MRRDRPDLHRANTHARTHYLAGGLRENEPNETKGGTKEKGGNSNGVTARGRMHGSSYRDGRNGSIRVPSSPPTTQRECNSDPLLPYRLSGRPSGRQPAPNSIKSESPQLFTEGWPRNGGGEMVAVRAAVPSLRKGGSSAATIAQSRTSPPHLVCEKSLRVASETLCSLLNCSRSHFAAGLKPTLHSPAPGPGRVARAQGLIVAIPRGTTRIATIIILARRKTKPPSCAATTGDPRTATTPGAPTQSGSVRSNGGGRGVYGEGEPRKMHLSRSEKRPPLRRLLLPFLLPRPLLASMAAVRRKDELTRVKTHTKPRCSIPAGALVASPVATVSREAAR